MVDDPDRNMMRSGFLINIFEKYLFDIVDFKVNNLNNLNFPYIKNGSILINSLSAT